MTNEKYWCCPHCNATMKRLDVGNFIAFGSSLPTIYCEVCRKPIDAMKVMRGEYDESAAMGCLKAVCALVALAIMGTIFMWCMGAFG